jgi:hypothetical protein
MRRPNGIILHSSHQISSSIISPHMLASNRTRRHCYHDGESKCERLAPTQNDLIIPPSSYRKLIFSSALESVRSVPS